MKGIDFMTKNMELFIKKCYENLSIAQSLRQINQSKPTLKDNYNLLAKEFISYDESFLNPTYAYKMGLPEPGIMSCLYNLFLESISNSICGQPLFVWEKDMLLVSIQNFFSDNNKNKFLDSLKELNFRISQIKQDHSVIEVIDENNTYKKVLMSADKKDLEWIAGYGKAISDKDLFMCKHWFDLDEETIEKIALHIVDAFFHGFISQSRKIDGRNNVRLVYTIGQEALAQKVYLEFINRDFVPIILEPVSSSINPQYSVDHAYSKLLSICSPVECANSYIKALTKHSNIIYNTCGFVRISSFGRSGNIKRSIHAFEPSSEQISDFNKYNALIRNAESQILKPDTLSFCSVAYPDIDVGENFKEIFEEFIKINTEESYPYELIQQSFIDVLDKCDSVKIKGMNNNITDINISFNQLNDIKTQSNFLNCGGDLNIPHGELFTTPKLKDTSGVYFVKEIFIRDNYFKNLYLKFENGRLIDYNCQNFGDEDLNKKHVFNSLLNGIENITMGEFAIGSNTYVYKVAKKYNLFKKLPILIAEKMGPHIAIGDPCFARGEDSPIFNIFDDKEMVARWNEHTLSKKGKDSCYFNLHTDITLPYDEIKSLEGYKDNKLICTFIENGKFVPDFAKELNKNMEEDL